MKKSIKNKKKMIYIKVKKLVWYKEKRELLMIVLNCMKNELLKLKKK
jgi:hypothetical protein